MSRSADPGHYFQTTESIAQSERKAAKAKNTLGDPVRLRSKALACAHDPLDGDGAVYVATAGGLVEHVKLETREVDAVYGGPSAPLTCLDADQSQLFAGCWDRNIYAWRTAHGAQAEAHPQQQRPAGVLPRGHTDFVKALLAVRLGGRALLLTGGADSAIIAWAVDDNNGGSSSSSSSSKLYTLKGHSRGVQALALDVTASTSEVLEFVSADSTNEIRRWRVTAAGSAAEVPMAATAGEEDDGAGPVRPLVVHETSVYALRFDADGDLWTASADKTAKCLVRDRQWRADTTLVHPDFVRDVVVDEAGGWVVTACRDEEVRVWERASGKLFHTFSGHHEEVTGLLLLGRRLVSVSIDATVRQWSLLPQDLQKARDDAVAEAQGVQKKQEEGAKSSAMLTEEEERELAELMSDDE